MAARLDVPGALRPKRRGWFVATAALAASSLLGFAAIDLVRGWSPADGFGLTFGCVAAALMVLEVLYALRRRLFIAPLKTGQAWLQLHVYGGTLVALFVLIHMGFRWPHGSFGFWLLALMMTTTITGLVGVMVQKTVPITLTNSIGVEAIYEKIPAVVAALRVEADELAKGASEILQRFHGSHVQPALAGPSVTLAYLIDVHSGRDRRLADFETIVAFLSAEDRERLGKLQSLVTRKLDLEAHYTWQAMLRWWPLVHVPLAMLFAALVAAHIAAVWWY